jgi:acetyl esterase
VLDPETQLLLRLEKLTGEPPVASLPIPEGRAAMRRQTRLTGGRQRIGRTDDLEIPTPGGPMRARLYTPTEATARVVEPTARVVEPVETTARVVEPVACPEEPRDEASRRETTARVVEPVACPEEPRDEASRRETTGLLVFLHGGGMVYGDLDTHDATCRLLAERAGVRVLALDYRLAPEHRFPAGLDDCWAGYQWAVEHAQELGVDPERVAVGGDSAGGYFGAVIAIRAANEGVPCAFQLLVYPATDHVQVSRSREMFSQGFYLDQAFMDLAMDAYLAPDVDRADADVSVQYTEKFPEDLAPALVVTAGFDPLRDEGETYARTLAEAGVRVELQRYPGFIHGFFNIVGIGRANRAAVAEIAAKLKAALNPTTTAAGRGAAER